ncbi:MAG: hypothetical protein ACHQKY_02430 [Terriglobia bacterium]
MGLSGLTCPDNLIELVQTGSRMTLDPKNAIQELEKLDYNLPRVIRGVAGLKGDSSINYRALSHLKSLGLQ